MDNVDLSGGWDTVWGAIKSSAGAQLTTGLTVIGVLILVFALGAYVWGRMRKQGDLSKLVWAIAVGAILAAPGVIFPILLSIVDIVANAGIDLYNATK
jgi:hypothetical protein